MRYEKYTAAQFSYKLPQGEAVTEYSRSETTGLEEQAVPDQRLMWILQMEM